MTMQPDAGVCLRAGYISTYHQLNPSLQYCTLKMLAALLRLRLTIQTSSLGRYMRKSACSVLSVSIEPQFMLWRIGRGRSKGYVKKELLTPTTGLNILKH